MREKAFRRYWESTITPGTDRRIAELWREHELSAVDRGKKIGEHLSRNTMIEHRWVLDVGCGYGGVSVGLAEDGATVFGLDIDRDRLRGARLRIDSDWPHLAASLAQGTGEIIPFRPASFDIVVCNDVLEHVESHTDVLEEICRVLKPSGWLYIKFPNRLSPANFRSDPHYAMAGVSLLGPTLGQWYTVKFRRRASSYHVGVFPIASVVLHKLRMLGINIVSWWPAPHRQLGPFTRFLQTYRLNSQPIVTMLCQKTG